MKKNIVPLTEVLWLAMGLVAIIIVQVIFQRPPFSDEKDYLSDVTWLKHYGFGRTYLVNLAGSAGPLYSMVHFLFEPITHLQSPSVRWVNIILLAGATFFIYQILSIVNTPNRRFAFYIMVFPMTFVISGLALTEIPALFFFCAAIYFIINANKIFSRPNQLLQLAIGGACMGFAIIGRQPYLLTLIALPLLFNWRENLKKNILYFVVTILFALALPLYVFSVWHGLVPTIESKLYKDIAAAGVSYRPDFFILCIFYFAVCMLLAAPLFFKLRISSNQAVGLILAGLLLFALNFIFHWIKLLPVTWVMERIFHTSWQLNLVANFMGSAVIVSALYFLFCTYKQYWPMQQRKESLFFMASLLLIALACTRITWGYSSRYAGQAVPLLVLVGSSFYRPSRYNIIRIIAGVGTGIISLVSYFHNAS